jgi:outer membrane protein TolC
VLTFEVALDQAVIGEQRAQAELHTAETMLRTFFPSLGARAFRVPDLATPSAGDPAPEAPKAAATPPQLASLQAQALAAREQAKSASLNRLPKVSLVAAGDLSAPSPRVFVLNRLVFIPTWEAGARVEWSLSQLTSGSSLAQREKATARAFSARVEEAKRKLDAERKVAVGNLTYAHERALRAGLRVEHATALAAARRGELEAGTALPLNVVTAETDLAKAKNEHIDALVERALAMARLDFIDGRTEPSRMSEASPRASEPRTEGGAR